MWQRGVLIAELDVVDGAVGVLGGDKKVTTFTLIQCPFSVSLVKKPLPLTSSPVCPLSLG